MISSEKLLLLGALALSLACGKTRPCKAGTLLVSLAIDDAGAAADTLVVTTMLDGATMTATGRHLPGAARGTIEVDFPAGYPQGKTVTITCAAWARGQKLAEGSAGPLTLGGFCMTLSIELAAVSQACRFGSSFGHCVFTP